MKLPVVVLRISLPITILVLVITLLFSYPFVNGLSSLLNNLEEPSINQNIVIKDTLEYLNDFSSVFSLSEENQLNVSAYSEIEISHLSDVKQVLNIVRHLGILSLFIAVSCCLVIIRYDRSKLSDALKGVFLIPIYVSVFIVGLMMIDFNTFFNLFHNILFDNNNWLLTNDDLLIQLFPQSFWIISILITIMFWILILYGLSKWNIVNKKSNK